MTDETATYVADWGEAHPGRCDRCKLERWVLTFNVDAETRVDLCRPCALDLATP